MWAAGTILLFFLTGKFPLFQSNDDMEALVEIACVVGKTKMEKAATLHSRTFTSNLPSVSKDGLSWRTFVERQNPGLYTPPPADPRFFPYSTADGRPAARTRRRRRRRARARTRP
jgi:cell division control protein 7